MKKVLFGILCLCALFALTNKSKLLSNNDDSLVKSCAEVDDDEEELDGGPYDGFYLFFRTMNPFRK